MLQHKSWRKFIHQLQYMPRPYSTNESTSIRLDQSNNQSTFLNLAF